MKETKLKQTEVGMIPSDWEVLPIKGLCTKVTDGSHESPKEVDNGYYMPSVKDMTDLGFCFSDCKQISKNDYLKLERNGCRPEKDDVLIAKDGSILKYAFVMDDELPIVILSSIAILRPNKKKIDSHYFAHYFKKEDFVNKVLSDYKTGTGVPRIVLNNFKEIEIAYPKKIEEQQRIANALSDVDSLIANLEKLIAKKKNIKQGAMQQLLTGKKRLPGFGSDERTGSRPTDERRKACHSERSAKREVEESSGYKMTELGLIPSDWENVNISKTCTIKARIGWQGVKSTEYLNSGDYILVTGTDFKNGFIDWSTCSYVSEWRFKQDKNIQIKKGDVLVTKDGTIGKVAFLNEIPMEGTLNSGVFVVRSKDLKKIDSVYLSLVFKSSWFDNFLDEITSGSTIVHLYQKDFVKFNFPIPSSIEEQTAIANVLSDMDAEISALETKLAKYRTLKTGMMQQLLTGKIRLV